MGDYLLMKAYIKITILLLSSALLYANEASIEQIQNNELSWVDEQVNAIKPARNGLKESAINVVKNPFIHLDKNKIKKEGEKTATPAFLADRIIPVGITNSQTDVTQKKGQTSYRELAIDAIINKSVLINGQWYKTDDVVQGYTIKSIFRTSIVLSKNNKDLILSTNSRNLNLKFKNK